MASAPKWKPWHEVVLLRDELKTGELSMSMFAADLDEVILVGGQTRMPLVRDFVRAIFQREPEKHHRECRTRCAGEEQEYGFPSHGFGRRLLRTA